MSHAIRILNHDAPVIAFDHRGQRLRLRDGLSRNIVLLEKARQLAVRIKDVAVLVGTVKRAAAQRVKQQYRFLRTERARAQHRHLAFQHLVKAANHDAVARNLHQVVGVIEAVRPPVGANRVVDVPQRHVAEGADLRDAQPRLPSGKPVRVKPGPVVAPHVAQIVKNSLAVPVRNRSAEQARVPFQGFRHAAKSLGDFRGNLDLRRFQTAENPPAEGQEPPQKVERHHRDAGAHQRIVGVVPLRPLRVHPQAGFGDVVEQPRQHQHQQLLGQVHAIRRAVRARQSLSVRAHRFRPLADLAIQSEIEVDRVARIFEQRAVRLDAIRNVGVGEHASRQQPRHGAGMVARRNFQQLQEVDHLVIAPIADVRPRVVRVQHLPVEAVAHDAIWVVAIGGGGAGKLEDHALDVTGKRKSQRFPVLENVAPVALVIEYPLAVLGLHFDGEDVPRPAGIAVTPAERQRQVFVR